MEEKKNNALEKAENIANKNSTAPNSSVNGEKRELTEKEKLVKAEKERAKKREEIARLKLEKKTELQKKKAEILREKLRRKDELLKIKEQRKKEEKERKYKSKQRSKDRNKGLGGWLAAVITLGISTLVLASALTFTYLLPTANDNALESLYRKSFYDTVEQVDNMDLNMSKVLASSDRGAMQEYLVDLAINSELAENDLHELPLDDENKYYTTKLINQIGDYAKYLNNKLINEEKLTEQDLDGFVALYNANLELKNSLNEVYSEMGNDFSFSSIKSGEKGNLLISNFNELQNLSVEYPELIYDGPFSDGKDDLEIKGLTGDEIDENGAIAIYTEIFNDYGVQDIKSEGKSNGNIVTYNIVGETDGIPLYAQISEVGGKLILFSYAGSCEKTDITSDRAESVALEFLEKLNIPNMKAVWINLSNNVYTINFALNENDVIVYSDLIKIRVCAESGKVIGFESVSYYTNHHEREIPNAKLTEEVASEKVSSNIEILTTRLVVVPIGEKSEKLCYEFTGTFNNSTYYIYISAEDGRQVEMFKVVEGGKGKLLM